MKGPFRRGRWKPGDLYAVPLADGTFGKIQAISESPVYPGIINIAVFDHRDAELADVSNEASQARVIALLATFRAEMNGGWWCKVGWAEPCVEGGAFPNARLADGVGHVHHGGAVIENLISAARGLIPWNTNVPEDYYGRLLAPGVPRPSHALILGDSQLALFREHDRPR